MPKTLTPLTRDLIVDELANIPEKYQKNFNSTHEGYAVILEEVRELENEVFFGEKKARKDVDLIDPDNARIAGAKLHRQRMKEEAVQIAAMCVRFIQELTD